MELSWLATKLKCGKSFSPPGKVLYTSQPTKCLLNDFQEFDGSAGSNDENYVPEKKKSKYEFRDVNVNPDDDMPARYRHIRSGPRTVRPEVYATISEMQAECHLSHSQSEKVIIKVANKLFNRNWKLYNRDTPCDIDTLPATSNVRRVEPYIEAMALSLIVEEMMSGEGNFYFQLSRLTD